MRLLLLVALISLPVAEIALFVEVGGRIGLWPTLAVIVVTGLAGLWLLRAQGLAVLRRARESLERGEMPLAEVFDGACLLVAGALLFTPGFLTDAIGLALLVPAVRRFLRRLLRRYALKGLHLEPPAGAPPPGGTVIEAEYEVVDVGGAPGPDAGRRDGRSGGRL
ncbi:MAG: FxsA family protein [Proteobacteria bacterium]|nr:FxsA family protein [Pseudomonadota bacterium]